MKDLFRRVKNVANDRLTRVLFYDQTLKKGYASLASFSKLFILRRVLITLIAYPLSILCWIFLVVLNSFTPVRIFRFERPQRPGFASVYIAQLEPLCRELQANGNKGFLVFIDASETTNLELLKLYASHFNLYLDDRSKFTRTIFSLIPKFGFINSFAKHSHYNSNWELPSARNLRIVKAIKIPEILSTLGLEPLNYVLISYPSRKYYDEKNNSLGGSSNRFIDPSRSAEALKLLINKGLKIVRVGQDTDDIPSNLKELPIIDLSGTFRSDAQDLWLFEHCFFNWSMGAVGTWHLAHKFDRPTLITDSYAFSWGYRSTLFTVKKVHSSFENRDLTFKEVIQLKGVLGIHQVMKSRKLNVIQNTSEQLCDAVEELISFATVQEKLSAQDTELLAKYEQIMVNSGLPIRKKSHSRPTISFLRDNQELLE